MYSWKQSNKIFTSKLFGMCSSQMRNDFPQSFFYWEIKGLFNPETFLRTNPSNLPALLTVRFVFIEWQFIRYYNSQTSHIIYSLKSNRTNGVLVVNYWLFGWRSYYKTFTNIKWHAILFSPTLGTVDSYQIEVCKNNLVRFSKNNFKSF